MTRADAVTSTFPDYFSSPLSATHAHTSTSPSPSSSEDKDILRIEDSNERKTSKIFTRPLIGSGNNSRKSSSSFLMEGIGRKTSRIDMDADRVLLSTSNEVSPKLTDSSSFMIEPKGEQVRTNGGSEGECEGKDSGLSGYNNLSRSRSESVRLNSSPNVSGPTLTLGSETSRSRSRGASILAIEALNHSESWSGAYRPFPTFASIPAFSKDHALISVSQVRNLWSRIFCHLYLNADTIIQRYVIIFQALS